MEFAAEFVDGLPSDPREKMLAVIDHCRNVRSGPILDADVELFTAAWTLMEVIAEMSGVELPSYKLDPELIAHSPGRVANEIAEHMRIYRQNLMSDMNRLRLSDQKQRYQALLGLAISYEFGTGDIARIQTLINELREQISETPLFSDKHRQRLLARLEKLQSELHRRMTSLDQFWALVGDMGVALGKFGTDAKPFVDRIKEILQIVWRTQARAEELPSSAPFPQLPPAREDPPSD